MNIDVSLLRFGGRKGRACASLSCPRGWESDAPGQHVKDGRAAWQDFRLPLRDASNDRGRFSHSSALFPRKACPRPDQAGVLLKLAIECTG